MKKKINKHTAQEWNNALHKFYGIKNTNTQRRRAFNPNTIILI